MISLLVSCYLVKLFESKSVVNVDACCYGYVSLYVVHHYWSNDIEGYLKENIKLF